MFFIIWNFLLTVMFFSTPICVWIFLIHCPFFIVLVLITTIFCFRFYWIWITWVAYISSLQVIFGLCKARYLLGVCLWVTSWRVFCFKALHNSFREDWYEYVGQEQIWICLIISNRRRLSNGKTDKYSGQRCNLQVSLCFIVFWVCFLCYI